MSALVVLPATADKLWTCCMNSAGDNNQHKKVRIYFITNSVWELLGMLSCYVTNIVTGASFKLSQFTQFKNSKYKTRSNGNNWIYNWEWTEPHGLCLCNNYAKVQETVCSPKPSGQALRSTRPPNQWVPGSLAGAERHGHEIDHLPPSRNKTHWTHEAVVQGLVEPDVPNPDVYDFDHAYIYLGWKNRLWFHHLLHRSYQIGNVPSWNVTVPYHNAHNHGKQVIHLGVNICKPASLRGPSCKNQMIPLDFLVDCYSKSSFNTEVMFLKMAK